MFVSLILLDTEYTVSTYLFMYLCVDECSQQTAFSCQFLQGLLQLQTPFTQGHVLPAEVHIQWLSETGV